MLQLSQSMRIFVCTTTIDFRKGIDGLIGVCRNKLEQDPFKGTLFVFRNRSRTAIRCLVYDGQGFWLCTKRLSEGKFKWWPDEHMQVDVRALQTMMWNGNPELAQFSKDWRKVLP